MWISEIHTKIQSFLERKLLLPSFLLWSDSDGVSQDQLPTPAGQWRAVLSCCTKRTCRPKRRILPGSSLSGKFHFNPWIKERKKKAWSLAQPLRPAVLTQGGTCVSCSPGRWTLWSRSADTLRCASNGGRASHGYFSVLPELGEGLWGREKDKSAERKAILGASCTWRQGEYWRRRRRKGARWSPPSPIIPLLPHLPVSSSSPIFPCRPPPPSSRVPPPSSIPQPPELCDFLSYPC